MQNEKQERENQQAESFDAECWLQEVEADPIEELRQYISEVTNTVGQADGWPTTFEFLTM